MAATYAAEIDPGEVGQGYVIDQGWQNYTAEEHDVWKTLFRRQRDLLPGRACREFLDGLDALGMAEDQIPDFQELSALLQPVTGWSVVAVEGLVPDDVFFELLAHRKFPAGNFIRTREQLDYLEEPDVFHDVFGHVPLLYTPIFADYMQAYGEGGLRAHREFGALKQLARLYWYTVEFGLIEAEEGLRIYGAGIVSSAGECQFSLEDPSPNRIGFDLKRVMTTDYRIDDYQQTYFVISSFEDLFRETVKRDFADIYPEVVDQTPYRVDEIAPGDRVIHEGTQAYAKARQAG
jgi:phenylalanine-4-hydroxylase